MESPNLNEIVIGKGSHGSRHEGVCAMELVAWLAGERHSDSPDCTSPVIASIVRSLNDRISDDAERTQLLRPLIPKLLGTAGSEAVETRRLALDASVAKRAEGGSYSECRAAAYAAARKWWDTALQGSLRSFILERRAVVLQLIERLIAVKE
jgi:hypothetical protein